MALGLALTGLTKKAKGKKLWTLDSVSWWNELELIQDSRFKKLDLGPDKLVYEAVLSVQEILPLNDKYKENFLQVFDGDPLAEPYYKKRKKMVDAFEIKLNHPDLGFVRIWVFDWDY